MALVARTLYDKLWDAHLVHAEEDGTSLIYIDRHLVHEVTSPQAFEGLRIAGRQALAQVLGGGHGRSQHPHHRLGPRHRRHRRPHLARAGGDARSQHRRVRDRNLLPLSRPPPGHRPRDRTRAGRHAARHDRRVRRLAHEHARRLRLPRLRHRHLGSRARARHPVPDGAQDEEHAGERRRTARARRDGQGRRARRDRPHRHGRRHRPRDRVRRVGDSRPVDGRADDRLQHGDRSRRARRHDRGRRHHDPIPEGTPDGAHRCGLDQRRRAVARRCVPTRTRVSTPPCASTRPRFARR